MHRLLDQLQALVAKAQLHIPLKLPSTKVQGQYAVAGLSGSVVRMQFSEAIMDYMSAKWTREGKEEMK